MTWIELPRHRTILALAIALTLLSFVSPTSVKAQSAKPAASTLDFVPPPPPPQSDRGSPSGRHWGGASRLSLKRST